MFIKFIYVLRASLTLEINLNLWKGQFLKNIKYLW